MSLSKAGHWPEAMKNNSFRKRDRKRDRETTRISICMSMLHWMHKSCLHVYSKIYPKYTHTASIQTCLHKRTILHVPKPVWIFSAIRWPLILSLSPSFVCAAYLIISCAKRKPSPLFRLPHWAQIHKRIHNTSTRKLFSCTCFGRFVLRCVRSSHFMLRSFRLHYEFGCDCGGDQNWYSNGRICNN